MIFVAREELYFFYRVHLLAWKYFRCSNGSGSAADAVQPDRATVPQQSQHLLVGGVVWAARRLPHRRVPHGRPVGTADGPHPGRCERVQLDDGVAWCHLSLPRHRLLRAPPGGLGRVCWARPGAVSRGRRRWWRRRVAGALAAEFTQRRRYHTHRWSVWCIRRLYVVAFLNFGLSENLFIVGIFFCKNGKFGIKTVITEK